MSDGPQLSVAAAALRARCRSALDATDPQPTTVLQVRKVINVVCEDADGRIVQQLGDYYGVSTGTARGDIAFALHSERTGAARERAQTTTDLQQARQRLAELAAACATRDTGDGVMETPRDVARQLGADLRAVLAAPSAATGTAERPDHVDQGGPTAMFAAAVARAEAHAIRWDEQRATQLLHGDPVDLFDLLDAAIEVVAHRGAPGYLDVLAVRIADIITEALP